MDLDIHEINEQLDDMYKFHVKNISAKNISGAPIKIVVLTSGRDNPQFNHFMTAVNDCAKEYGRGNIVYDFITSERVRMEFEHPRNLIDKVLEADIHFILGHIHQGVIDLTQWNVVELYEELKRLQFHPGWPWGVKIECPILTQDKYRYLIASCSWLKSEAVGVDTNPTLKVSVRGTVFREASVDEVEMWKCIRCSFQNKSVDENCKSCCCKRISRKKKKRKRLESDLNENSHECKMVREELYTAVEKRDISTWCESNEEGEGWVVKAPYTCNKKCRYFAKSVQEVFHSLSIIADKYGPDSKRDYPIIPYAMIQPCMKNRAEYKAVVLNGKAFFVKRTGGGIAFGDEKSRLGFAEEAVRTLKEKCAYALLDGLVRVDFFQNAMIMESG